MRRFVTLIVAAGLVAVTIVGLAAASRTVPSAKQVKPAAESLAYLPAGVAPCTDNWLAPGCDVSNTAFSQLTQLNTSNVGGLKMVWQASFNGPTFTATEQSQPICCANGMMYQTTRNGFVALDPLTGKIIWQYQGVASNTARVDSATPVYTTGARSEAYDPIDNYVFTGQQDGSIVALKATTGAPVWTAQVSGIGTYGSATHAESNPYTVYYNDGKDGLVFAGPNGGESPIRGHLDAYDAKTGKLVWRSYMTPDPNQLPYILTWANPAEAAVAGATVWSIASIDPTLGDIYFGTGNPYPYTGRQPGKDLWSDSIVALNINNGQMRWYYQTVHHDLWDYDCPTPSVRFNAVVNGKLRKILAASCKTGYIYELDATNGHPIFPIPETPVPDLNGGKGAALNNTWPTQPEPQGGAAQILIHCPTAQQAQAAIPGFPTAPNGTQIVPTCPFAPSYNDAYVLWGPYFALGGTDYPRMSFDPLTNDLYVCANVTMQATENRSPTDYHQNYITTGTVPSAGWSGSVSALNMTTNKLDWQAQFQANQDGACYSGVLSTAGGLVFSASKGNSTASVATLNAQGVNYGGYFYAYDAKTGKQLWSWQNEDQIQAPPITYMFKGKQYVAIYVEGKVASGQRDRLTVFSL
jgi:alcohol dehydrogenase (cytochrome c)